MAEVDDTVRNQQAAIVTTPPARILLVDDQGDSLKVYQMLLEGSGHSIAVARSAAEARAACETSSFDLLISDIRLPDGDGVALFRELQAKCGLRGIALSGLGYREDIRRSLEAGFVTHLVKPVDIEKLDEAIALALEF